MKKISDYSQISDTAMILAAGYGVRMRPLTADRPKPLLEVGGRAMLDWALDRVVAFGVNRAIVNSHYLAAQIERHLKNRHDLQVVISHEETLLDTGGGIKKVLPFFATKPFFVLSGDMPYTDETTSALERMAQAWDPDTMDALLLVAPLDQANGFSDRGDFHLTEDGRLFRHDPLLSKTHVFLSVLLIKPELYACVNDPVFSNNALFDLCESRGRLAGLIHNGTCYHVGTPQDLEKADHLLTTGQGWRVR